MRGSIIIGILALFLQNCRENIESPSGQGNGYDFFPIVAGQFRVYEVLQVTFNTQGSDTSVFQLKETISDSIVSGGIVTYLLSRETRTADTLPWEPADVWSVRRDVYKVVVYEENIPYIKMSFPVKVGGQWDGHAMNPLATQVYEYTEVPSSADFPDSLELIRVILADVPQNLVNQDERHETYAKGIGLVEKDYLTLGFCTANCEQAGQVENGLVLKQTLIAYGQD